MSGLSTKRWLCQDFILKFYPSAFSKEVEDLIRALIEEVALKHPLWTQESLLLVNEIKIYVNEQEVFNAAKIEYRPKFGLIMLQIGLADMIKDQCDEKYHGYLGLHRGELSADMIDVDTLKAQLFHEFGHPLDETNPKFHYTESTNLSAKQAYLMICLWNAYIDGRLSKANLPICIDLKNRTAEACRYGGPKANIESIKKAVTEVWDRKEITYKELTEIARKEIPYDPES